MNASINKQKHEAECILVKPGSFLPPPSPHHTYERANNNKKESFFSDKTGQGHQHSVLGTSKLEVADKIKQTTIDNV